MNRNAIQGIDGRTGPARPAGRRTGQARTAAEARLLDTVEAAFHVDRAELRSPTRGYCRIAFARQTGMYLARVALGMTLSDVGRLFGRDRTTVSHACRLIEDMRDDASFDTLLQAMEGLLRPGPRNAGVRNMDAQP